MKFENNVETNVKNTMKNNVTMIDTRMTNMETKIVHMKRIESNSDCLFPLFDKNVLHLIK